MDQLSERERRGNQVPIIVFLDDGIQSYVNAIPTLFGLYCFGPWQSIPIPPALIVLLSSNAYMIDPQRLQYLISCRICAVSHSIIRGSRNRPYGMYIASEKHAVDLVRLILWWYSS